MSKRIRATKAELMELIVEQQLEIREKEKNVQELVDIVQERDEEVSELKGKIVDLSYERDRLKEENDMWEADNYNRQIGD